MATYNKFHSFVEAMAEKKHDLGSDQIVLALTSVAPANTDTVLADLTEVAYTNCSTRDVTTASSSQTAGTYTLSITDITLTASGGSVGPFRYVTLYNDTATSDELIGWYDYGSSITLSDGESLAIDFAASTITIV
ncbi:hypothetical protein KAI46_10180 [bacterium]|nr:hypothetical protein [bacterium]